MTSLVADVLAITDQVWAALDAVPAITAYDGEVVPEPSTDDDGRVHAYAVFYPGAGVGQSNRAGGTVHALAWGCQITCVGADRVRAMWCVDQVRAAFIAFRLTVGSRQLRLTESTSGATPLRRDSDTSPPRFYVPLLFHTST